MQKASSKVAWAHVTVETEEVVTGLNRQSSTWGAVAPAAACWMNVFYLLFAIINFMTSGPADVLICRCNITKDRLGPSDYLGVV